MYFLKEGFHFQLKEGLILGKALAKIQMNPYI
jgi:hypothetical protein